MIHKSSAQSFDNVCAMLAESQIHGYSLAADAKVFRLSRTAENHKDFKAAASSEWRKDNVYAKDTAAKVTTTRRSNATITRIAAIG